MKHVNIIIYGKVQKTGFRTLASQNAVKMGVTGYIKNLDEGRLYVEVEGEEENLKSFINWCHCGPMWAKVTQISTEPGELKNFTKFDILTS